MSSRRRGMADKQCGERRKRTMDHDASLVEIYALSDAFLLLRVVAAR